MKTSPRSVSQPATKRTQARSPRQTVRAMYRKLSRAWGPQHWWPAESPLEVIVGAILTQNTSWTNVERALANLRAANVLTVEGIRGLTIADLERLIRSSGYFRQKARRLKDFIAFLDAAYDGSLDAMFAKPTLALREELLAQKGIGPETADSILLYAGHHPIFVVDAYTRRVLERHEAITATAQYDEVRSLVEEALQTEQLSASDAGTNLHPQRPNVHPPSAMSTAQRTPLAQTYNEMHGLFVQLGKHFCTKREPKCDACPLGAMLRRPVTIASSLKSRRRSSSTNRPAPRKSSNPQV